MSATQYKTNERERDEIPHLLSALETAEEGDLVMLAGKGHETYQIVKGEYVPFSEEQIVKDYFNKR